ncbi:MAG: DUF481 domain-containing protein [Gammaproteobacteria bacterium]|nr:DUF481 domain-containing protein [Gammaproteobacteria bacterium]MBU1407443.1 DUF481 domain-containing protein [Gammaproteobacteria bacterium]MBU1531556.1 DUF481 domain-containing protein [Gammaproteobacteria bacterium]
MDVHDQLFTSLNVGSYSSVSVGISGSSGNRDSQNYGLELNSTHRGDRFTWQFSGEINDTQTEGVKTDEQEKAQVRAIAHLTDKHGIEVFTQYQRDVLEGLSKHTEGGIGYRYESKAAPSEKLSYALGVGVVREQVRFITSPTEEQNSRANLYVALQTKLGERSTLTFSAMATPNVSQWSDWRGESVLTLRVPISEKLSVSLQTLYDYDAEPEVGIESYNLRYSTGISYSF